MIEWFAEAPSFIDIDAYHTRARGMAKRGQLHDAIWELIKGLHNVHGDEGSWHKSARLLYELFCEAQLPQQALTVAWYLDDVSLSTPLLSRVPGPDRARTFSAQAAMGLVPTNQERELYARAAAEFESSQLLVHAALDYERARDTSSARALWSRLAGQLVEQSRDHYAIGLSLFNVARTCRAQGDDDAAHQATVSAVHHMEAAADHFEHIGQRERAFDCYQVLVATGQLTGGFEHVLEGSVNAVRILREDHLVHHALRLYRQTLELAEAAGEFSAAATLAHEMTDYARQQGMSAVADYALGRQAELWAKLADGHEQRNAPAELIAAALRASLLNHAELGQYQTVAALYRRLEAHSEGKHKAQLLRARARYRDAHDQRAPPRDPGLGPQHPPAEVWFDDLIEWAEAGSASARCAGIILSPEGMDDRTTRRTAVLGRLAALSVQTSAAHEQERALEILANHLAPIGLYAVLPALEALFQQPNPSVRIAAVRAIGRHAYKRSFLSLERAIQDPDLRVRAAAVEEIVRQRFEHAFEPLARIYRQSEHEPARLAALQALAHLDLREAQELLLGVLDHGSGAEAKTVRKALAETRGLRFLAVAREVLPTASKKLRKAIISIARKRGDVL